MGQKMLLEQAIPEIVQPFGGVVPVRGYTVQRDHDGYEFCREDDSDRHAVDAMERLFKRILKITSSLDTVRWTRLIISWRVPGATGDMGLSGHHASDPSVPGRVSFDSVAAFQEWCTSRNGKWTLDNANRVNLRWRVAVQPK